MDTPAEHAATRADHGIDWDYVNAHHRPVTLIRRPAYEGWVLSLFGAILVGLIGLLGWAGYVLSTVQADLRQVQGQVRQLHAQVAQLEPLSAGREPLPAETAPRVTALEPRPGEHVAKPQAPSPPPGLPPARHLPRTATSAPRTPQDHQAHRDMRQQAAAGRFGAPVPDSFGTWLAWHPDWELRWMRFQVSGHPPVSLYHITYKPDPGQRYTSYWDPDRRTWHQWTRWPRGS